ncbi:MAG TPA: hypothetical protein VK822_08845 [Acetobacteraceae bacterium]|nr:hypothetical protein [Acetobacteraceae bacterium]
MEYLLRPRRSVEERLRRRPPADYKADRCDKVIGERKAGDHEIVPPVDESRSHHAVQLNVDCRIFKRRPAVGVALRTSAWRVICAAPPLRLAFALANDAQFSCQDFYHSPSGGGVYGQD